MRKGVLRFCLIFGLVACCTARLLANVIITEPTGGNNISADTAQNSTNGAAFTALGNIVIKEGLTNDFAAGTGKTLILSPPFGWRFNPAAGAAVSFSGGQDITSASIAVTFSNLTVTFTVAGTTKPDQLTISGMQVQPTTGAGAPAAGYITRSSQSPGTAIIAGIDTDITTFGLLNTIAGAPRALVMQTQPSPTAVVGVIFPTQPEVAILDQFGNFRDLDVTTVVTASRAAGTGTLHGTLSVTAIGGTASFFDLYHDTISTITVAFTSPNLTSVTSSTVVVTAPPADRLAFTVQPASGTAGAAFGVQPVIKTRDSTGADSRAGLKGSVPVTLTLTSGSGTLLGTTTLDIGTNFGNGTITFTNLEIDAAGTNKQLTAQATSFVSTNSAFFTVNASTFSKLQLLVPGESPAPATPTGKTGTPSAQTSGSSFGVTVNAVDNFWNIVKTATDTVSLTSSDTNATLPGNTSLVSGTNLLSVTLRTAGTATLTASDVTDTGKTSSASPSISVLPSAASRLMVQTQPSATATAGGVFAQQPVIRLTDASGNFVSDNGRVITAARGAGTGTLQGTLTATAVNGVATFANLSYNIAETITLSFSSPGLTNTTSSNIVVSPTTADRLAFATQPGGVSRAGALLGTQPVVKTQDRFGNFSSAGLPAHVNAVVALNSGTGSLLGTRKLDIGTAVGNGTAAYSNLQCSDAGSKQLIASAFGLSNALSASFMVAGVERATGGSAISADTVGGSFTSLTGPIFDEAASGDAGVGTIVLNVPSGFMFDPNAPAPGVVIQRLGGSSGNTNNINGVASGTALPVTSWSTNQITFTITNSSSGGVTCALVWTNLRVRPLAGTPLASGNLTKSGTANLAGITAGSTSFGTLTEVPGLATRLAFTTQPGSAMTGSPFGVQPVVRSRDQFGNDSISGLPASKILALTLTSGTGPLLGTPTLDIGTSAANGIAVFTDLELDTPGTNYQLTATAAGFTNATSSVFKVVIGQITIQTQPSATAGAGVVFAQQPVIRLEDLSGNLRTTDNSTVVTVIRNGSSGTLQGNTSITASSGLVVFTNLSYTGVETITLSFNANGFNGAVSSNVVVSAGPPARLAVQTQPSATATAGVAFAQQPVVRVEDALGNLVNTDNGRVVTVARGTGSGTLQGTLSANTVNGLASFANLSYNIAETITLNFSSSSLTNATSSNIIVNPTTADRLAFATQPGGVSRAGSVLGTQPVVKTQDRFGNASSVGLGANLNVALALASGTGSLLGTTAMNIGSAGGNGTVAFTNLQCSDAGSKQLTASASALTNAVSLIFFVGGVERASGGSPISADTVGGSFTTLTGPTYYEAATGDVGLGTIILNAPTGFCFDTNTPKPSVIVQRLGGNGNSANNINGVVSGTPQSVTSCTTNQITFIITNTSSGGVTCSLVWSNVRVRPLAGTPLASGNLTSSGTASLPGVSAGSTSFGTLTEVAGLANRLAFTTQPGAAAAGSPFGFQPVLRTRDQFGNDSTTGLAANNVLSLTLASGTGPLLGTTSLDIGSAAVNGIASFTNLEIDNTGTNFQLSASAGGFTSALSDIFTVFAPGPGRLTIQTQPSGAATAGLSFSQQPVIRVEDQFGLLRTSDNSTLVTASRGIGTGPLQGTTTMKASGGLVTFTNLSYNLAETITLTFASGGLTGTNSSSIIVGPGAANRLSISQQPSPAAIAGVAFAQQPVLRVEDQFGNLRTSDNATVVSAARSAGTGVLQGTTIQTAIGGLVTFSNLAHTVATNITIAFSSAGLNGTTSSVVTLTPAGVRLLTFATQPGSAVAGAAFGIQPALKTQDQFGNDSTVQLAGSLVVNLSLSAGTGPLLGTTALNIGTNGGNGLVTFTNLELDIAGADKQLTASASGLTNATSSVFTVVAGAAHHLGIQTQPSSSATAGTAFVQQPVIRVEDRFGNLRTSDNTTPVSASRATGSALLQGTTTLNASGGLVSFTNLVYNVAETITLGFASGSLTGTNSSSIAVSAGAASRLTLVQQPSATATAGVIFARQPVVRVEDQFGNLRLSDNSTVISAARSAGSGTLQGNTNITAVSGLVTFTNLAHNVATNITIAFSSGSLSGTTSSVVTLTPAVVQLLTFVTQPGFAGAGAPFGVQPAVRTQDQFGNNSTLQLAGNLTVTLTLTAGTGPLLGTTALDIGTNAGNGLVTFTNLEIDSLGTDKQLTVSASGLSNGLSTVFAVGAGAAHHLTIQTQPSPTASAGVAFAQQPVLRVEDQFGNLRTSDNSTAVKVNVNGGSGSLLGSTNITAVGGLVTFTNLSYTAVQTISLSFNSTNLPAVTSSNIVVSAGPASQLAIVTQPPATAQAGVAFSPQPVVRVTDQFGNLRASDNTTVVTATRSTGSGTLLGTTSVTAVNGIVTFTNLSQNVASTITIQFASGSLSSAISSQIVVSAGPFVQLLILAPGETAAPGTASGKTGAPNNQTPDTAFNVTVNAVDANWNVVGSVSDTVALSSSDATATLPANAALVAGTRQFSVTLREAATNTITAADFTDPSKVPSTSSPIRVSGRLVSATGGNAISADNVGGTFTTLSGPVYSETTQAEVGVGTIILNAPSGFVFDTGGVAPTVRIDRLSGGGQNSKNINGVASGASVAMSAVSSTQMTFTVTNASNGGVFCKLSWQDLRVRPVSGTPLAVNKLTKTGTSSMAGITNSVSNFGTLREVAGAAALLVIQSQPSTAVAGVSFSPAPTLLVQDQFGNLRSSANGIADNTTIITAARASGSGVLQGVTTATSSNGVAVFGNMWHTVATNITINFSSGILTGTTSGSITVGPATANQLVFTTDPANGTVGQPLLTQPALRSLDAFGNNSAVGLGASKNVNITLSSGTGPLLGTTTLNIGTNAGNGLVTFIDLRIDSTGTNKQLTASAGGLASAVSKAFTVLKGSQSITFGPIADKVYGDAPFVPNATASSSLPLSFSILSGPAIVQSGAVVIQGIGPITVQASQDGDANWNAATPVSQSFNVSQAMLLVMAENKSRPYGSTNPPLTAAYIGFVNGDNTNVLTGSPILSTAASETNSVADSPYPILIDPGTLASTNYQFTFTNGQLTVTKAVLTVTAENKSRLYATTNPPLTATVSGFVNGEDQSVVSGNPTLSTPAGLTSSVAGNPYPIIPALGTLDAANYQFAFANGALTITPSLLTAVADNAIRLYGQTNPIFTGILTGVQNGDTLGPIYTSGATTNSVVGTYPIMPGFLDPDGKLTNYTVFTTNGTLTVAPALLTVKADDKSRPYGATNPVLTASYNGFLNGDTETVLSGSPSLSTLADTNSTVTGGPYPIEVAQDTLTATNYQFAFTNGHLIVTKAVLTVTADNKSRVYAAANPPLTATLGGFVNGEDQSVVSGSPTLSTPADVTSSVGGNPYPIIPALGTLDAANYGFAFANGALTITPSVLTAVADDATRVYGQTNPVFTGTLTGLQNGDNLGPIYTSSATTNSQVGTYPIVPGFLDPNGKLTNYTIFATNGTLRITPALLTVRADDKTRPYGAANPVLTASYTGWLNGDTESVLSGNPSLSTSAGLTSSVPGGPYSIVVAQGTLSATNYQFAFTNGLLTVTKSVLAVTADNKSRVYASVNPPLTATLSGFLNGDDQSVVSGSPTLVTTAGPASNVAGNPYPIIPGLGTLNAANYQFALVSGTLTITPYAITAVADDAIRVYGQTNPVFTGTLTGVQNGDNLGPIYTSSATTHSAVGSYPIVPGFLDPNGKLTNYTVIATNGTLTITPALLIVKADDKSRPYGATNPVLTASYSGWLNGDSVSVLSGSPDLATTANTNSTVAGSPYPIQIAPGTLSATNYTFTFTNGQLNVTRAILTVTAENKNRLYAAANPPLTATLSGFVNGEDQSVVNGSPTLSTPAVMTSSVTGNPWPIIPAPGTLDAANYQFVFANGTLTITPSALTVVADSATRVYGQTNPVFTGIVSGVQNGDNLGPIYASSAITNSNVGAYPIVPGFLDPDGRLTNYTVFSTNGTLTITPALLTVKADDKSRTYGAINPLLTASYSGWLNGDNSTVLSGSPSLTTIADTNSTVAGSPYPIQVGQGTLSATNYTFTFTNGQLTVTRTLLTITADNKSRPYAAANPTLTATLTGFVNGENQSVINGSPTLSIADTNSSVAGNPYPIIAGLGTLDAANYQFAFVNGALTITPSALTVVADNATRMYGHANPIFTGTLSGVQNGDNLVANYMSSATINSQVGSYAIVPVFVDPDGRLTNYTVLATNGSLTITPALLTVKADDKARPYGATNPVLTASYSGWLNGDSQGALSGTPSLSTTANTTSTVAGSPYQIQIAQGTLAATNYQFSFTNGTLTITQALVLSSVSSSQNPSRAGSNITFTATVSAAIPGGGVPSGTVEFISGGSPLSPPVALSSGSASMRTASLPHGTNIITVEYAGDGNFAGSTNQLQQMINALPVAYEASYSRATNAPFRISVAGLLTNYTSDADGDLTRLVSIGTGTNGAAISLSSNWICYVPSEFTPNRNTPDHFEYVITDGFDSGLVTNQVSVLVVDQNPSAALLTKIMVVTNGIKITFNGTAGATYHFERATTAPSCDTNWQDLGAVTADTLGQGEFIDLTPPPGRAFYRLVLQ